jgi:hypothetical protein
MTTSTLTDPARTPAPPLAPCRAGEDELLRFLVAEFKTCAETGAPVTLGNAVAIEAEDRSTGKRATKLLCSAAFEEIWLPRLAAMPFLPDVTVTVHDGRELARARR